MENVSDLRLACIRKIRAAQPIFHGDGAHIPKPVVSLTGSCALLNKSLQLLTKSNHSAASDIFRSPQEGLRTFGPNLKQHTVLKERSETSSLWGWAVVPPPA